MGQRKVEHLIVDDSPLFQEGVHSHDCAHITSQVSPTGSQGEVFGRVEAITVDHKVAVVLVDGGHLGAISSIKKLGQGFFFQGVDLGEIEPGGIGGNDNGLGLGEEVLLRLFLLAFSLVKGGSHFSRLVPTR